MVCPALPFFVSLRTASLVFHHRQRASRLLLVAQVDIEHLSDAIRQGAYAVGAQTQGAPAADAAQLADDLTHTVGRFDG